MGSQGVSSPDCAKNGVLLLFLPILRCGLALASSAQNPRKKRFQADCKRYVANVLKTASDGREGWIRNGNWTIGWPA